MPIDYSKYPPNWKSEIRPRILARANYQCECCGFSNYSNVYRGKIKGKINWYPTYDDAVANCGILAFRDPILVVLTIAHLDHDETITM